MFKVSVDDDLIVTMDIHGNTLKTTKALALAMHAVEYALAEDLNEDIKLMHALVLSYYKEACHMKVEEVEHE